MANYNEMGKVELRAACKAAGISYGKLNNDGMREALIIRSSAVVQAAKDAEFAAPVRTEVNHPAEYYVELAAKMDIAQLGMDGVEGHCPCCGIDLGNGVSDYEGIADVNPKGAKTMKREITCLGCGGEWGPVLVHTAKVDSHTGKGLKIEKNAERQNGVRRPSIGGKCRAVWDALDALQAELEAGEQVTAAMVKELAKDEGWNANNASIEFYQWRKFHGISKASK